MDRATRRDACAGNRLRVRITGLGHRPKVYEQVANVAMLPGIERASYAMPDAHWGYGFLIVSGLTRTSRRRDAEATADTATMARSVRHVGPYADAVWCVVIVLDDGIATEPTMVAVLRPCAHAIPPG